MLCVLLSEAVSQEWIIPGGQRYENTVESGVYTAKYAVFVDIHNDLQSGGAIRLTSVDKLCLYSCLFDRCSTKTGTGGCLHVRATNMDILRCCFSNSTSQLHGKCIYSTIDDKALISHTSYTLTGYYNDPYTYHPVQFHGKDYDLMNVNSSDHKGSEFGASIGFKSINIGNIAFSTFYNGTETQAPLDNYGSKLITYSYANVIKCVDISTITGVIHCHFSNVVLENCGLLQNSGRVLFSVYTGGSIKVVSSSFVFDNQLSQGNVVIQDRKTDLNTIHVVLSHCATRSNHFSILHHHANVFYTQTLHLFLISFLS